MALRESKKQMLPIMTIQSNSPNQGRRESTFEGQVRGPNGLTADSKTAMPTLSLKQDMGLSELALERG
jgi:hypothetical protein